MNTSTASIFRDQFHSWNTAAKSQWKGPWDARAIERRFVEVFEAMKHEIWLPMGFRSLLVQELSNMRRAVAGTRLKLSVLREILKRIRLAAEGYGKVILRSETFYLVCSIEYELGSNSFAA